MPLAAVTFDFHNTLAHCDSWFQHEIRTLVPAILFQRSANAGQTLDPATADRATEAYRTLRRGIIEHGRELDATACAQRVLEELSIHMDDAEVDASVESIMRACLDEAEPVPGAIETVRDLADSGVRLGVISAAVFHPFLEWALDKFGILDAFDVVVTSASAGYYKTRPELYLHTLKRLGADPARSVHIGDSHRFDVEGARRAGMRTVWFDRGSEPSSNGVADLTVRELAGLAPLLFTRFGDAG